MDRKPLVLTDGANVGQIQPGDELDIPLEQRVQSLQESFDTLVEFMVAQGFELPEEIINR